MQFTNPVVIDGITGSNVPFVVFGVGVIENC